MKYARIKPSREESAIAMVVGILMFFVGIFVFLPDENAGFFSVIWVIFSSGIVILSAVNIFTEKGIATEEIHIETKKVELPFDEQLRRLESLRREKLISEREYQHQRKKLLS